MRHLISPYRLQWCTMRGMLVMNRKWRKTNMMRKMNEEPGDELEEEENDKPEEDEDEKVVLNFRKTTQKVYRSSKLPCAK